MSKPTMPLPTPDQLMSVMAYLAGHIADMEPSKRKTALCSVADMLSWMSDSPEMMATIERVIAAPSTQPR